jgi:glycosyltransferase involved in cell wall biosynthesis
LTSLVARQRYGLHAQVGEHFGIAPAELVRAGCITFVARPGGPVEIVGHEADLTFSSPTDAVDTIDRVLGDRMRLQRLRAHLGSRREVFTEERFMREIRNVVEEFEP